MDPMFEIPKNKISSKSDKINIAEYLPENLLDVFPDYKKIDDLNFDLIYENSGKEKIVLEKSNLIVVHKEYTNTDIIFREALISTVLGIQSRKVGIPDKFIYVEFNKIRLNYQAHPTRHLTCSVSLKTPLIISEEYDLMKYMKDQNNIIEVIEPGLFIVNLNIPSSFFQR